jgi:hypothetical protein
MMLWIVGGGALLVGTIAGKWVHLLCDERCEYVEGGLRCTEREEHRGPPRITQHGRDTWVKRDGAGS